MLQPLVSILMLNYNGFKHTRNCLSYLSKVKYHPLEIILADNGSTDGTVEFIKKHYPKIKLIENKENLGFCKGNNSAFKKSKGRYILFLNNDTEVTPEFLSILVKRMEKDKTIGITQPKIRQLIRKEKLDAACSFLTPNGFLYHWGYAQDEDDKKYNKSLEMYSAKGACFLVRRDVIEKVGLFDEDFTAYFEETDFCHRVWLAGYKVVYEPKAEIFHLGGADNKQNPRASVQFNSFKNRINCYLKNFELIQIVKILPYHLLFCFATSLAYLFLRQPSISLSIIKAVIWNIEVLPRTLKKRKYIQTKIRKVRDNYYLKNTLRNARLSYYYNFLTNAEGKYEYEEI